MLFRCRHGQHVSRRTAAGSVWAGRGTWRHSWVDWNDRPGPHVLPAKRDPLGSLFWTPSHVPARYQPVHDRLLPRFHSLTGRTVQDLVEEGPLKVHLGLLSRTLTDVREKVFLVGNQYMIDYSRFRNWPQSDKKHVQDLMDENCSIHQRTRFTWSLHWSTKQNCHRSSWKSGISW